MKTIVTLDLADQPYGFPQLDGSGSLQATGSLYGTASWAINVSGSISNAITAETASYVTSSNVWGPYGADSIVTSSYALTASYALNGGGGGGGSVSTSGSTLYSTDPAAGPNFNTTQSIFLGSGAGLEAHSASYSNFIGSFAGENATYANLSNFIGSDAGVSATAANWSNFIGDSAGYEAAAANTSNFIGQETGFKAYGAEFSNFIGWQAGYTASFAVGSNFIGSSAGAFATNATHSNFIGDSAGYQAANADNSNFIGSDAGNNATNAHHSNFVGDSAGSGATYAYNSNFIGTQAGYEAINADQSNFLGQGAGYQATSASYSTLIGFQVGSNVAGGALGIKSNNIVIGTNITLPNGTQNSTNIGGTIFAIGSYATTSGNPYSGSQYGTGKVGINKVTPIYDLDVSGSGNFSNGLTVTGSLIATVTNATNASSGSNFVVSSTLAIDESLIDFSKYASTIVGSNNMFQQATGSWTSAHCKYTVYKGANSRAGEFITSWNGTTVSYYDNATVDIGSTSDITFSSAIVSSQIQINAVAASSAWTVKMLVTYL